MGQRNAHTAVRRMAVQLTNRQKIEFQFRKSLSRRINKKIFTYDMNFAFGEFDEDGEQYFVRIDAPDGRDYFVNESELYSDRHGVGHIRYSQVIKCDNLWGECRAELIHNRALTEAQKEELLVRSRNLRLTLTDGRIVELGGLSNAFKPLMHSIRWIARGRP